MENRNLKLVADLIRLMLEKQQQEGVSGSQRRFSRTVEEFLHFKSGVIETPESSSLSNDEKEGLQERVKSLEKEVSVLKEQIQSQQEMLQLTVTHLQGESGNAGNVQNLSDKVFSEYFQVSSKLGKLLPSSQFFEIGDSGEENTALCHVIDKFGIVYLVTVRLPSSTQQSAYFLTILGLEIENILTSRRFADSAQIIERIRLRLKKLIGLTKYFHLNEVDIGVCMIDIDHNEVEFASTGHKLISVTNGLVNQHSSGLNKAAIQGGNAEVNSDFLLNKINFRKDTTLFIPFSNLSDFWDNEGQFQDCLRDIALKPEREKRDRLESFFVSNPLKNSEKQFQIISIQF